ncbi:MAG: LPS export ABC transporter periplasmic protein LptC [Ignavibacteriales bacterium]|nr:LPS export ABC transporter periplasmic protein LptC [Ignavibacteriales bacterium]
MRIALVVLILLLSLSGCEEKIRPTVLPEVDSRSLPQQESWNSTVLLSDTGLTKALIRAGYIRVYEDPRQTLLSDGVVVDFFDSEERRTSILTSNEAKVNDLTNDLEAWGTVVVVSLEDSTTLKTERLFWDNRRQLIHTQEFVRIVGTKERIQGHGLEAQQNLRNYRIFRVSGEAQAK